MTNSFAWNCKIPIINFKHHITIIAMCIFTIIAHYLYPTNCLPDSLHLYTLSTTRYHLNYKYYQIHFNFSQYLHLDEHGHTQIEIDSFQEYIGMHNNDVVYRNNHELPSTTNIEIALEIDTFRSPSPYPK